MSSQVIKLPRVNIALLLNVCSIFICYFLGLGIITAIISLVLLRKDKKIIASGVSISNKQAYKIAVISSWLILVINLVYLIFWLWIIKQLGWENITNTELMQDPNFLKNSLK